MAHAIKKAVKKNTKKKSPPEFVRRLLSAFEREMPGCDTDLEWRPSTNSYRFAVEWDGFPKRNAYKRQDKVWKIAADTLDRDELFRVSVILTFRPEELAPADD